MYQDWPFREDYFKEDQITVCLGDIELLPLSEIYVEPIVRKAGRPRLDKKPEFGPKRRVGRPRKVLNNDQAKEKAAILTRTRARRSERHMSTLAKLVKEKAFELSCLSNK